MFVCTYIYTHTHSILHICNRIYITFILFVCTYMQICAYVARARMWKLG